MPVNTTHAEYDATLPLWQRMRTVLAGEDAVKAAGELYLPKLDSQTDAEYQGYKLRAAFFNATARTAEGFVGLLFRRDPLVRMPGGPPALAAALAGFVEDADLLGTPVTAYAKAVLEEVIAVGRCGTLVDWEAEAPARAYLARYAARARNGETGLRIRAAILSGERNPKEWVKRRAPQITRSRMAEREAALCGDWREEHLFVLRQSLENSRHVLSQLAVCAGALVQPLAKVGVNPATVGEAERPKNPAAAAAQSKQQPPFKKLKAGTGLKRDMSSELTRVCGVDLTRIIGLNVLGVLILIAEIGGDMNR